MNYGILFLFSESTDAEWLADILFNYGQNLQNGAFIVTQVVPRIQW